MILPVSEDITAAAAALSQELMKELILARAKLITAERIIKEQTEKIAELKHPDPESRG